MSRIRVNSIKPISGASVSVSGSLVVTGNVTAEEFVTERVSTSIIFKSGSTKFGDSAEDRHEFTGTLDLTGSALISSTLGVGGIADLETYVNVATASIAVNETNIGTLTTDLSVATSSIAANETNIGTLTTDLTVATASIAVNETNIGTLTTDLTVATASIAANETNIGTLTTDLLVATASIAANETNIGTLTTDLSVATSSIAANETNIGTLTSDLLVATASIAANEASISDLTIASGTYALSASLTSDYININQLKAISSGSADFAAFQAAIALL